MKIECDTYDFAERLTDLRIQKGVSARDMSLSMGQTSSYINNIENKSNLPSMKAFFCICEYLEITPLDFFNYDDESPLISNELIKEIRMLNTSQTNLIYKILKEINGTTYLPVEPYLNYSIFLIDSSIIYCSFFVLLLMPNQKNKFL